MTLEQEYEQAMKIVEEWLRNLEPEPISANEENVFKKEVRSLLSLTWPDGQPVIGVLSKDQELPESNLCHRCEGNGAIYADGKAHSYSDHAPTIPCPSCGGNGREVVDGEQLLTAGFRRTIQKESH